MKHTRSTMALLVVLVTATTANAAAIRSGTSGYGQINKGVFELGLDGTLLVNYDSGEMAPGSDDTRSQLSAIFTGGVTPRYFVAKNLSLGLNLDLFLAKNTETTEIAGVTNESTSTDYGLLAVAMAHYYVRLGFGMFFKPGIGGGGFWGKRERPVEGTNNQKISTTLSGGAARIDLGMVYFAGQHFNLKAGPDVLIRFGSEKPEEGDSTSFTSVDVGFNVGFGYTF